MSKVFDLNPPKKSELARHYTLKNHIQNEIKQSGGYLSFARFMEMALYYPNLGYYNAEQIQFGADGDFITAPIVSPLFARCFAEQIKEIFSYLKQGDILELGAGNGRFASDLIQFLSLLDCLPTHYYIYEISPALRTQQQLYLKKTCPLFFPRVKWLDELPSQMQGIIIANEVLDALPVYCFQLDQDDIKERCVGFLHDQFVWQLQKPTTNVLTPTVNSLRKQYGLEQSYQSEINLQLPLFMKHLARALTKGVILLCDYGYGQKEYYHPERNRGTLSCFYKHHSNENALAFPGLQDISAHVDFTRVIENAAENSCFLGGFTSQASFLLACGLMEWAEQTAKKLSSIDEFHLHQSIKTLTLPTQMGDRVKVMALTKNYDHSFIGFRLQDRRRDL